MSLPTKQIIPQPMGAIPSARWLGTLAFLAVLLIEVPSTLGCLESEQRALLMFKRDLIDESNRLASWVDLDGGSCCDWTGVACDNSTGHVTGLHLQNEYLTTGYIADYYGAVTYDEVEACVRLQLRGRVNSFLLELKHLMYLNLSGNNFGGTQIPSFLGLMTSLEYLDLSYAGFGGEIPPQIGNLTNLLYLNLGGKFQLAAFPFYVAEVDYGAFSGQIPSQIGNLTKLKYFGLAGIPFSPASIESLHWLSGFSSLRRLDFNYLNLSKAVDWLDSINTLPSLRELRLSGCGLSQIPPLPMINNLSSPVVLDLSGNAIGFNSSIPEWIFQLHNLNTLDLSYNNFGDCMVPCAIPEGIQNLTHLRHLDLSWNGFNSSIPDWMYSFSNGLEFLNLRDNDLQGVITSAIGNLTSLIELRLQRNYGLKVDDRRTIKSIGHLCNLKSLDLSEVQVNLDVANIFNDLSLCASNGLQELSLSNAGIFGNLSNVPFEKFKALTVLRLAENSISGSIPRSFGNLQSLMVAEFYDNLMTGAISGVQFSNLTRLKVLFADGNCEMELRVNPSWLPPFQLKELNLQSWKIGQFPAWLRSQKDMGSLILSNCSIVGTIPKWFWNLSMPLRYLDLSNNQLIGQVPIFSFNFTDADLSNNLFESIPENFWNSLGGYRSLDLSKNQIAGELPSGGVLSTIGALFIDLSCNNFSGQVPRFSSKLLSLDFSNNSLSGSLSDFLCHKMDEPKLMEDLNLGDNSLSGEIPNCWAAWNSLMFLTLNNNNFTGHIPSSMGNLGKLESLHLRNNSFTGGLPLLLRSRQTLQIIDLGDNQLEGKIPTWIGKLNIKFLDLRSNKFHGRIPREICSITTLQILDLAWNNLSGPIPQCINNIKAMITGNSNSGNSSREVILVKKGRMMEYHGNTLDLIMGIDLSNNFLSGNIPDTITALAALQSLNLSHNLFMGRISQNIGDMKNLESLDLSLNKLTGEIPLSLSRLNFLNYLNLSSNNLIGKIPSSTQLQSLNASSFLGNELCGPPLSQSCDGGKRSTQHEGGTTDETKTGYIDVEWFCVSMALGCVFGFWSFVLPILYGRQWRIAYYGFLERVLCI